MSKKFTFLTGVGVGYLVSSRARREQVITKVKAVWRDPRTQHRAEQAQSLAKERLDHAAALATEKIHEARAKADSGTHPSDQGISAHEPGGTLSTAPGSSTRADTDGYGDSTPMGTTAMFEQGTTRP